jgi:hypothetical protein
LASGVAAKWWSRHVHAIDIGRLKLQLGTDGQNLRGARPFSSIKFMSFSAGASPLQCLGDGWHRPDAISVVGVSGASGGSTQHQGNRVNEFSRR